MTSNEVSDGTNPSGLCLLSLDGGGVRGLSTLYILKTMMERLNHERQKSNLPPVKPCEVFDLIGGTSTGGSVRKNNSQNLLTAPWLTTIPRLIAIMLGRLEMSVDECISAYIKLTKTVFKRSWFRFPIGLSGRLKARFDSTKLKKAIDEVIISTGGSPEDSFDDGQHRKCKM